MTALSWSARPVCAYGAFAAALATAGCGVKAGANGAARDPERQSIAEHDVGVDALLKGDRRAALAHAKKAIEFDDDNADAHMLAATIYVAFCSYEPDSCRLPEAEVEARAAIKKKKDFREAKNTLGVILIHEKKYDEAVAVLKPLADDMLYSTPENAWGNLGWAYLERGDVDLAVEALKRALAVQPSFCWGATKLAEAYERKGALKAAQAAVSQALTVDRPECKGFADAFEERARVLQKLGEVDEARADLERCSKVGGETPAGRRCTASLSSGSSRSGPDP